jgi:hypothetical protein
MCRAAQTLSTSRLLRMLAENSSSSRHKELHLRRRREIRQDQPHAQTESTQFKSNLKNGTRQGVAFGGVQIAVCNMAVTPTQAEYQNNLAPKNPLTLSPLHSDQHE